jgi:hypothetical protein
VLLVAVTTAVTRWQPGALPDDQGGCTPDPPEVRNSAFQPSVCTAIRLCRVLLVADCRLRCGDHCRQLVPANIPAPRGVDVPRPDRRHQQLSGRTNAPKPHRRDCGDSEPGLCVAVSRTRSPCYLTRCTVVRLRFMAHDSLGTACACHHRHRCGARAFSRLRGARRRRWNSRALLDLGSRTGVAESPGLVDMVVIRSGLVPRSASG